MNANLQGAQFNDVRLLDHATGTSSTVANGVSPEMASLNAQLWRKSNPRRYGAAVVAAK